MACGVTLFRIPFPDSDGGFGGRAKWGNGTKEFVASLAGYLQLQQQLLSSHKTANATTAATTSAASTTEAPDASAPPVGVRTKRSRGSITRLDVIGPPVRGNHRRPVTQRHYGGIQRAKRTRTAVSIGSQSQFGNLGSVESYDVNSCPASGKRRTDPARLTTMSD